MLVLTPDALDQQSARAARSLRAGGVQPGERVALWGEPAAGYVSTLVGLWRLGAVAVPLSTRLPSGAVPDLLQRVSARFFLSDEPLPVPAGTVRLGLSALSAPASAAPGPAIPPFEALPLNAPAALVFTSGSTGTPKAALLTLGNLVWSARGVNAHVGLRPGDGWLLALPLFHVGGLGVLVRCLVAGAHVVLPGPGASPADALRRGRATHASFVATHLLRLLRDAPESLDGLRAVLLGGSAIPEALLDAAHARGVPVATSYGLTEMASTVTATLSGATHADLATSGVLLPHRELKIEAGELLVRGPTRFLGYLNADGALDTPFDADGWYATGDLGRLDAAGRLVVMGRRDNLFISGGENVQPEEIEAALLALGGVERAVVVPVPDATFGHRPVAFVALHEGAMPDARTLADALAERLPRFKVPVAFWPWPDASEGLKPDRRALQREAARRSDG